MKKFGSFDHNIQTIEEPFKKVDTMNLKVLIDELLKHNGSIKTLKSLIKS